MHNSFFRCIKNFKLIQPLIIFIYWFIVVECCLKTHCSIRYEDIRVQVIEFLKRRGLVLDNSKITYFDHKLLSDNVEEIRVSASDGKFQLHLDFNFLFSFFWKKNSWFWTLRSSFLFSYNLYLSITKWRRIFRSSSWRRCSFI